MNRRDLLRAAGAATALAVVPGDARTAWARVAAGHRPTAGLSAAQRALVTGIADVILPRTDTPGATDVGIADWVDLIVSEYYAADSRAEFISGLDAIASEVRASKGREFADLDGAGRIEVVAALDAPAAASGAAAGKSAVAARATYRRLKGLVVHGYFTSQRVEREVLRVRMAYPTFEGAADVAPRPAR